MTTGAVSASRTSAALEARRRKSEASLQRVHDAIARIRREEAQVSIAGVARRADVSRTFLYDNQQARAAVAAAMAEAGEHRSQLLAGRDDEREATWRERALNARSSLNALASAHFSARSGTCKPNGPRKPSSGSPRRTPPSSSGSAS